MRRRLAAVITLAALSSCRTPAPPQEPPASVAAAAIPEASIPSASVLTASVPLTSSPSAGDPAAVAPAVAAAAAEFWNVLGLAGEAVPLEAWSGRARATCREVARYTDPSYYADMWCTECTLVEGGWRASFRFFPDLTAGQCTLQEIQAEHDADGTGLMTAIESGLSRSMGRPASVSQTDRSERGSYSWHSIRRWSGRGKIEYLYMDSSGSERRSAVSYLLRRSPLLALQAEDPGPWPSPFDSNWEDRSFAACRDAGLPDCDAVRLAWSRRDQEPLLAAVHAALDQLEKAPRASPRAAPLAFWLDFIATDGSLLTSHDASRRAGLERRGVAYADGYDGVLVLQATWLRDLAASDPASKWGQLAVLKMMCFHDGEDDDDPFRAVIARGEAFLRAHPGAAVEREVITELAMSHETWWSLSKADPRGEDESDVARWRKGADAARRRAIELYRRLPPRDDGERTWLEQRLFRLERGIDTGQRAHSPSRC